jgi:hypothetical protein
MISTILPKVSKIPYSAQIPLNAPLRKGGLQGKKGPLRIRMDSRLHGNDVIQRSSYLRGRPALSCIPAYAGMTTFGFLCDLCVLGGKIYSRVLCVSLVDFLGLFAFFNEPDPRRECLQPRFRLYWLFLTFQGCPPSMCDLSPQRGPLPWP